eukprot:SAG11_NODE_802_length_7105_cov_1.831573_10_plen_95_part_00
MLAHAKMIIRSHVLSHASARVENLMVRYACRIRAGTDSSTSKSSRASSMAPRASVLRRVAPPLRSRCKPPRKYLWRVIEWHMTVWPRPTFPRLV